MKVVIVVDVLPKIYIASILLIASECREVEEPSSFPNVQCSITWSSNVLIFAWSNLGDSKE